MSVHLVALLVFVALFVLGTARPINMGALALVGAVAMGGLVFHTDATAVISHFPGDLFVVLVGVTFLFGIARANGTVDWLVASMIRVTGGRVSALPWVMFLLSTAITALGAVGPATVAILLPIGMRFAEIHRIRPLLIGLMVSLGTTAGCFSPLGVFGVIVNGVLARNQLVTNPSFLFAATFVAGFTAALGSYLTMRPQRINEPSHGPHASSGEGRGTGGDVDTDTPKGFDASRINVRGGQTATVHAPPHTSTKTAQNRLTLQQGSTLAGFAALAVGALAFGLDVGFTSLAVAVALALIFTDSGAAGLKGISWETVLLIGGVITYVGVLEDGGTISWLGSEVSTIGSPLFAALFVCFIAAAVSAFASTTGMLGALIPLAIPLLATGEVGTVALVTAIAISSSLVDTSPFSTNGALAIANAPTSERSHVYRGLLRFGIAMIFTAPLTAWAILIAPGWL
ncbi:MAG: SLC13 family permease [Rhodococcus sp. (in: high G+C Gram-positive bacteria)]